MYKDILITLFIDYSSLGTYIPYKAKYLQDHHIDARFSDFKDSVRLRQSLRSLLHFSLKMCFTKVFHFQRSHNQTKYIKISIRPQIFRFQKKIEKIYFSLQNCGLLRKIFRFFRRKKLSPLLCRQSEWKMGIVLKDKPNFYLQGFQNKIILRKLRKITEKYQNYKTRSARGVI